MQKKIYLIIILISLTLSSVFAGAQEQQVWPIITFTCDKQSNLLKLKNEVKWGASGKNFPFNAEQGTYNPWNLVRVEQQEGLPVVVEASQWHFKCELSGFEYTLNIRPKIFNPDYNGTCGKRLSVTISVYKGAKEILKETDMVEFCHGNAPVLRGIKITGGSSEVKQFKVSRASFY